MDAIPLVRATALAPILDVLRSHGIPFASRLAQENLAELVEGDSDFLIPFQPAARFAERVAREEGIKDLGLRAGERTGIAALGSWGRRVAPALTLHEALDTFLRTAHRHTSAARYWVIERAEDVLLCHRLDERIELGREHALHLVLLAMINLVRHGSEAPWFPREVRFAGRIVPQLREVEALGAARITSDPYVTAVAIPRTMLTSPLPRPTTVAPHVPRAGGTPIAPLSPAGDFLGSLKQALAPLVLIGTPELGVAAEIAGTSARTLQRRLSDEGLSYTRVLDEIRFGIATHWLDDPDRKLIDVAMGVGYSDPAHFTRAFRRWTGVSPREFRRQRVGGVDGVA